MVSKSDPASTVDAEAESGQAASFAELALISLTGSAGATPVPLRFQDSEGLTIGRDEQCAIYLSNTDVSRRHAVLERTDAPAGLLLTDLNSRNGTRVNGRAVQSARLQANDVVRMGGCVFVVGERPSSFAEIAPGLLGGAVLKRALSPLLQAARSDLPIVLEGETGTGKEIVTRAIHEWSARSGKLVAINCAALPQELAEGELFGYRRGAFTGADRPSLGFFRSADGGTLLLDEISDLPLLLQAKLLRAIEQKEVQPLGEGLPVAVDVRIVVAGQTSLLEAVKQQQFRGDLLARLSGITLHLPALRQRREDVVPLFIHFMRELRPGQALELEPELLERLVLYDWPFNVRELLQLARRLAVLQGTEAVLRAQHLPPEVGPGAEPSASKARPAEPASAVDLGRLVDALRATSGNVTRAAAELGITRQRAYRLLEEHAVDLAALTGKRRPSR
ncbi:MAG: sigma 54-interacting transcriptional regulator [Pseudomonadota bacterium]